MSNVKTAISVLWVMFTFVIGAYYFVLTNDVQNLEKEFAKTGNIWERYDENGIAKDLEYKTQPMLGWTAGVYNYFWKEEHDND